MDQDQVEKSIHDDELSVKELIRQFKSVIAFLKSKWLLILIVSIIGSAIGLAYSFYKKPRYTAIATFVLDEGGKSGGLGQFSGLASLAGIDGGSGGGLFQGDNIIELYKSRLMIEKTLLSETNISNKKELLIDRYITFNHLREQWKAKGLGNISFNQNDSLFSRTQDSIMSSIVMVFKKGSLSVAKPDRKLSVIQVQFISNDELFAKEFTNKLVDNVNSFYIFTKTKKSLTNVKILQRQTDSVRSMLNTSIVGVASAVDATPNANPMRNTLRVPSQRKQVDVQANTAIYSEMAKNLEVAKISLRQETPLIQVIDKPVLPLDIDRLGKLKGAVFGFIAGFFITIVCLLTKRTYNSLV